MLNGFKKFLVQGNMIDMAVGFIFGAAFSATVKSLVTDIVMPPIGMLLGEVNFSQLFIPLDGKHYASLIALDKAGAPAIKYGLFINELISFFVLGFVAFMIVTGYNKLKKPEDIVLPVTKVCSECAMEIPLAAKKCPYCGNINV